MKRTTMSRFWMLFLFLVLCLFGMGLGACAQFTEDAPESVARLVVPTPPVAPAAAPPPTRTAQPPMEVECNDHVDNDDDDATDCEDEDCSGGAFCKAVAEYYAGVEKKSVPVYVQFTEGEKANLFSTNELVAHACVIYKKIDCERAEAGTATWAELAIMVEKMALVKFAKDRMVYRELMEDMGQIVLPRMEVREFVQKWLPLLGTTPSAAPAVKKAVKTTAQNTPSAVKAIGGAPPAVAAYLASTPAPAEEPCDESEIETTGDYDCFQVFNAAKRCGQPMDEKVRGYTECKGVLQTMDAGYQTKCMEGR